MQENINVTGSLTIVVYDVHGNIKEEQTHKNLVVTTGLGHIASRMVGTTQSVMSHMELGTDDTATNTNQTALLAPIAGSRTALDSLNATGPSVVAIAQFVPGVGTGALTEAGIFNNTTAGVMLCRTVFPVVNKGVDDLMVITWTITLA